MRSVLSLSVALFSLMLVAALVPRTASAHELPEGFSGFEDPARCGECHAQIYGEWEFSLHANSSKLTDPVHSAVHDAFAAALEAKGKRPNYHCGSCHSPTADNLDALMKGDAVPDPENPSNMFGVTCSFCHMVEAVVDGEKFNTYKLSEGIKGGNADSSAPHGVIYSGFATSLEMCLGCHGKKINTKGGVICSMDEEGISDCLTCHMAEVDGPPAEGSEKTTHAFHGIYGGHDPDMLKKGAKLGLEAQGGTLTVTLENPNPHFFPSTNPLRVAYVKVEAFDAIGVKVFSNFETDPSEDPQAMLIKVFKAGDKVGVPSWEAEGVARDTRLKPGEERTLTYALPEGAKSATARLYYRLIPPAAIEKFGIKPDGTVEKAHMVSEAELDF